MARELGVGFRATSGPLLLRSGDLAAILTNLQPRDVLFIDEIHRLQPAIEETLYPAMEDFRLDLIIGEGPAARTVRIDLPPFTLIGATTRSGLLTPAPARPLRHPDAAAVLRRGRAARDRPPRRPQARTSPCRRTARWRSPAAPAARRASPAACCAACATSPRWRKVPADRRLADAALERLEVDALGLDAMDRRYLRRIAEHHNGGPVGVETLAAALAESRDTIEEVIEPFLIQEGLVLRTPRGRMLGDRGWRHLGLAPPAGSPAAQRDLLYGSEDPLLVMRPHILPAPGLFRGHGRRRHGLPRHLSPLGGAGADRSAARGRASRTRS